MPPKKKFNKKKSFIKKTLINRAVNSIVDKCKVNNEPLKYEKKYSY